MKCTSALIKVIQLLLSNPLYYHIFIRRVDVKIIHGNQQLYYFNVTCHTGAVKCTSSLKKKEFRLRFWSFLVAHSRPSYGKLVLHIRISYPIILLVDAQITLGNQ
mmetsp:Transcript_241/g.354  ORF Transcript_241/g.354 Transcript_241/m.354 type:complete len:105 (-) Transcript_241:209-523(-)